MTQQALFINSPKPAAASDKQVAFVKKLLAEKDLRGTGYDAPVWTTGVELNGELAVAYNHMTKRGASAVIDALMALPRKKAVSSVPSSQPGEVEDGIYFKNGDVLKVQTAVHGSGRKYAKILIKATGKFEYRPGLIRSLSAHHKMTLEQAKEYGALYGMCCNCGKTLTNEDSIEAGIGPVCAKKFA